MAYYCCSALIDCGWTALVQLEKCGQLLPGTRLSHEDKIVLREVIGERQVEELDAIANSTKSHSPALISLPTLGITPEEIALGRQG